MSKKETRHRSLYIPEDVDDAVLKRSEELGISISRTYWHLAELGAGVVGIGFKGGEVYANLPNGDKIQIASQFGVIRFRQPEVMKDVLAQARREQEGLDTQGSEDV